MDCLSQVASVIAVIQLTGSLVELCGGYIQKVKGARDEILNLQRAITGLQVTLQGLQSLLESKEGKALPTSSRLFGNLTDCLFDLRALETRLDPKSKKIMRKVGWRALKWPLKRTEVEEVIQNLERYKTSFILSLQVDQSFMMASSTQDKDFEKLEGVVEAVFGSYLDQDEPQCLRGTRTVLLQQIMDWAKLPSQKSIFWLKGMAGTGKSTISRTVAGSLEKTNHLGASFFFKRSEGDRGNAKKFFPTLTRQLMLRIPELGPGVREALHDDPDIVSKSLKEQFEKLLLKPLRTLDQAGRQVHTLVIVIDALDECEHARDVRAIIGLLPSLRKAEAVSLRVFVTSRPELPIDLGFSEIASREYQDLALHDIPEEVTERDIHMFLQYRFAGIKHEKSISEDWPGEDVIQELVKMSVPLFISTATICRYIQCSKLEPKSRLAELLEDQAKYVSKMDKTYLPILGQLLDDQESDELEQQQLLQEFQDIVGVIILLATPLPINTLSLLLEIGADKISNRLNSFRSVLSIPNHRDLPVRILHLSFRDFLVTSRTKFFVDERQKHKAIAKYCLKIMRSRLRNNICNLASPGTRRAHISDHTIRQYLPLELQYSCHYWTHHFEQGQPSNSETEDMRLFLQEHFLHWLEAISLLGLISEVVGMIDLLHTKILGDDSTLLAGFLHDAKRFVLKNQQIADEAPLQIYCAGLVFAPETALIRTYFKDDLPSWICQLPKVNERWGAELQTLEGHSDWVESVAFSPDGRLLASGSSDQTVRLWDMATGSLQVTLKGHSSGISSVAFSPDGRLLASGSGDRTVRLWDMATGSLQQTLKGHSSWISSVAFSPDGRLLASGSGDRTVRLWDVATGSLQQTLKGHSSWISSVAFSSDGQLLASGSNNQIVRLWDTATKSLQQTFKGNPSWFRLVAFSPDGRLLASGSSDQTVRLWDMATGSLQQTLKGHSSWISSVAFSPNGQLLASGSGDRTVRLWDMATGSLQQTLKPHSSLGGPLAFSPNGQLLASVSIDQTVRLWDTATGSLQQTLKHHSGRVHSVAFSPDGQLLASGSDDRTVRLWDMATGSLQQIPEGHSDWVHLVAFSPDGQLLASGSNDRTVRLWDVATGSLQQTLKGHSSWISSVAFSPDGRLLASSSDNQVRLWDVATKSLQQTLKGHSYQVFLVVFSPNGQLLASSSNDHTVRLWDVATGSLQQTLKPHSSLGGPLAFSPDSQLLASSSGHGIVGLWDTATGSLQQTLKGHSDQVRSVAFSPDGRLLVSGSNDQTVRLWDIATGGSQQTLPIKGIVTDLQFSQDSSYVNTNLGSLKIKSSCGNSLSNSPKTHSDILVDGRDWITLKGTQVLWLPPEARPSCSAIRLNTLALGHASGRISIIGFRV